MVNINKRIAKLIFITAGLCFLVAPVQARNEMKEFSIKNLKELDVYDTKLGNEIKFYFGTELPEVQKRYGEWASLKKTNAFNKTDEYACQWAMLSALLSLEKRAIREGGNAVFIKTNNDHSPKSSSTVFECEVGNVIASVAVLGTVVKINR